MLINVFTLPVSAEKWQRVSIVKSKSLPSVYFVVSLINHVSTVFIGSLYNTLKVVTKPLDINQKKTAFQDNKS